MNVKESMNTYYDERAEEYDEIYTLGKGPASINDPNAYKSDVLNVLGIIEKYKCEGTVIDIPCGTAFWMPAYYKNAGNILLVDQSQNMILKATERAKELQCFEKCRFIQKDIFHIETLDVFFDMAIVGFFISHLSDIEEINFFSFVKRLLKEQATVFIIDSVWSDERALSRMKSGIQTRKLNDGTVFDIYKKYFTVEDVQAIANKNGLKVEMKYFGKTMFLASFQKV